MPGKIFINYRRGDDPGYTQALYQRHGSPGVRPSDMHSASSMGLFGLG
jgi:hypothetical protein